MGPATSAFDPESTGTAGSPAARETSGRAPSGARAGAIEDAPLDVPLDARAQRLIACLNELAAGWDGRASLSHAAAATILHACAADHVALYLAAGPVYANPAAAGDSGVRAGRLLLAGIAVRDEDVEPDETLGPNVDRRLGLRAAAWTALVRGEPWHRELGRSRGGEAGHRVSRRVLVAMPLGGDNPNAVLALAVAPSHADTAIALVARAAPAVGALARLARLSHELERADRRHAQLQETFSHSSEAILMVDRDYHLVEHNPAFAALLGVEGGGALGRHCSEVLTCRDERGQVLCGTPTCPLTRAFASADGAPYREVIWQAAGGKSKEVSASFATVPSPDGPRGVIIARDRTLVNAANRMRANFISMVSHELRTPINAINGFLEIVLEGHVGKLTARQEEFLNYARTSTHQLMTLVEDILFISRADTGQFKLRFVTVALRELVAQLFQNFQGEARAAEVELRTDMPEDFPPVYVDELRLQQVLSNLINNAIKFTPPGGTVTVSAAAVPGWLRVGVGDTGEGIPIEEQSRIFERFYQSESAAQGRAGGYGLGLAIAKLIVEQHGGRIWVDSRPGVGSTFSFTLPPRPPA